MEHAITYVGLDVHQKEIHVAVLSGTSDTPRSVVVPNEEKAVERLRRKVERESPGPVRCCYEAGPCGYALQRQLTRGRVSCAVIAPALIPRKPGERIKTDRRDARKLAAYLRAGVLTEVHPPTEAEEAVRDLSRARDDAREDLQRARHRLSKLLLRRGHVYGRRMWTRAHRAWVDTLRWTEDETRNVVEDYLLAIDHLEARLRELDRHVAAIAETAPYQEPVAWLRCFRGIDTLTAVMVLAEWREVRRFLSPRALMAYTGLVPGEHSSGEATHRGPITKTGNRLVRRLLIEAAWHYRHPPKEGAALRHRRQDQPARVVAIAERAQTRLCQRFRRLAARQKPRPKIVTAVARELVGFLWAVLQGPQPIPT